MHNETPREIAESRILETQRLVAEGLAAGCRLLPDEILPLADTFCGCGLPEVAWAWVRDYLDERERLSGTLERGALEPQTGADWIAAYLLDHLQLTEHGSSVPGWLTDAGRAVLQFLRDNGPDWQDGKWIGSDGTWRADRWINRFFRETK